MQDLSVKVKSNWIVNILYKSKFYFGVASGQIGFLTNKLPELMGFVYLAEKTGLIVPGDWIVPLVFIIYFVFVGIGYLWREHGLFHAEQYITAERSPVQKEMLDAARLINKKFGGKKNVRNNKKTISTMDKKRLKALSKGF